MCRTHLWVCAVPTSGCVPYPPLGVCRTHLWVCAVPTSGCVPYPPLGVCRTHLWVCAVPTSGCVPYPPLGSGWEPRSPFSLLHRDCITLALPKRLKRERMFSWYHSKVPIFRTLTKQRKHRDRLESQDTHGLGSDLGQIRHCFGFSCFSLLG